MSDSSVDKRLGKIAEQRKVRSYWWAFPVIFGVLIALLGVSKVKALLPSRDSVEDTLGLVK